jgi:ribokinase
LPHIDYLIINDIEAGQLAQGLGLSESNPKDIARKIAERSGHIVIVTMGANGSVSARGDDMWHIGALDVEVVDTTGAGDAYCGIFAACLQAEKTLAEAMHHASVGASLSCLGLGAQAGMPAWEDIVAHLPKLAPPKKI